MKRAPRYQRFARYYPQTQLPITDRDMNEISLPRLQLFEFHELPWYPAVLRRGTTESLRFLGEQTGVARMLGPLIGSLLKESGTSDIIDLCSGSCGPILDILPEVVRVEPDVRVTVSDLYPDQQSFLIAESRSAGRIRGHHEPLDARHVPSQVPGLRTMFNAFHHFSPRDARAILEDAYARRVPIAIFEITERSLTRVLNAIPGSVLIALAAAAMSNSARVLALSFVLPVIPVSFAWDGFVSCLRSYTKSEWEELVVGLDARYCWRQGQLRTNVSTVNVHYLIGMPAAPSK